MKTRFARLVLSPVSGTTVKVSEVRFCRRIIAQEIYCNYLSALSADMGVLTAGQILFNLTEFPYTIINNSKGGLAISPTGLFGYNKANQLTWSVNNQTGISTFKNPQAGIPPAENPQPHVIETVDIYGEVIRVIGDGDGIALGPADGSSQIVIGRTTGDISHISLFSNGFINIESGGDMSLKAGGTLSLEGGSISVTADTDISMTSGKKISITAGGLLELAGSDIDMNTGGNLTVNASNVTFEATSTFTVDASIVSFENGSEFTVDAGIVSFENGSEFTVDAGIVSFENGSEFMVDASDVNFTGAMFFSIGEKFRFSVASEEFKIGTLSHETIILDGTNEKISVGVSAPNGIIIDGKKGYISSYTFTSGIFGKGFRINSTGDIEANDIVLRGRLKASVFQYDEITSVGGRLYINKASSLSKSFDSIIDTSMKVDPDPEFDPGEWLWIKEGIKSEVLKVSEVIGGGSYTVQRGADGNPGEFWTKGTSIVSLGAVSGDGFVLIDSQSQDSPYIDIYERSANTPFDAYELKARLGNLNGIIDATFPSISGYGLYSKNVFLTGKLAVSTPEGITVIGGGDITIDGSFVNPGSIIWKDGVTTYFTLAPGVDNHYNKFMLYPGKDDFYQFTIGRIGFGWKNFNIYSNNVSFIPTVGGGTFDIGYSTQEMFGNIRVSFTDTFEIRYYGPPLAGLNQIVINSSEILIKTHINLSGININAKERLFLSGNTIVIQSGGEIYIQTNSNIRIQPLNDGNGQLFLGFRDDWGTGWPSRRFSCIYVNSANFLEVNCVGGFIVDASLFTLTASTGAFRIISDTEYIQLTTSLDSIYIDSYSEIHLASKGTTFIHPGVSGTAQLLLGNTSFGWERIYMYASLQIYVLPNIPGSGTVWIGYDGSSYLWGSIQLHSLSSITFKTANVYFRARTSGSGTIYLGESSNIFQGLNIYSQFLSATTDYIQFFKLASSISYFRIGLSTNRYNSFDCWTEKNIYFNSSTGNFSVVANSQLDLTATLGALTLTTASGDIFINTKNETHFRINGNDKWHIRNTGFLMPNEDRVQSIGSADNEVFKIYCYALVESSDERLKTDITNINLGLDFVDGLRPISYKPSYPDNDISTRFGFSAQEVKKLLPDDKIYGIVTYSEDADRYGLVYSQFIPILTKAIQELNDKLDAHIGG
jgi:hypothetical protein